MFHITDRQKLVATIVAMAILTSLPTIVGYLTAGPNRVFVPRIAVSEADTGAYYSNIEQVRQSRLLVSNQFTSESQQPSLFHPLWILLGWLARWLHVSTPIIFWLARLAGLTAFIIILDRLISRLEPLARSRWLALWLVLTASGLGWVLPAHSVQQLVDRTPIDLWVSEANTFLTLTHSSLFILSQLMIGFVLWQAWLTSTSAINRWWRWTGPILLLVGLVHPYDLVLLFAITVIWLAWTAWIERPAMAELKQHILRWVFAWWWAIPVVLYYFLVVLKQPAMLGWLRQNVDITGPWWSTAVGFGLLLPLAASGFILWRRQRWAQFLAFWFVVTLALVYFPGVSVQRRFFNGVGLPLSMLAAVSVVTWLRRFVSGNFRQPVALALVVLLAWSNLENLSGGLTKVLRVSTPVPMVMLSRGQYEAMRWIRDHSTFDDVTWSNYWNGNTLAGLMARTVALGHGNQTIHTVDRLKDWFIFTLSTTPSTERLTMVERLRVHWLLWNPRYDGLGGYHPNSDPMWRQVFAGGGTEVYELQAHLAQIN